MSQQFLRAAVLVMLTGLFTACGGGSGGGSGSSSGGGNNIPVPAAPTGAMATAGNAQVALTWNAVTGASGYYANRATSAGGPYTQLTASTTTSFTDTGLTNGTTYYYVITAFNGSGTGARSAEVSAQPAAPAPAQPGPTGLLASSGSARVTLSWDVTSDAASYSVKRALVASGPYTTVGSPTTNYYVDTTVTNGIAYYYVVTAMLTGGETLNSAEVTVTPAVAQTRAAATVDFGAVQQTIRGFGGSSAWITNMNANAGMADILFGNANAQQIGMSILRVRIDPSPDPGGHANWATERGNAQLAIARGARVFATPWTPPASMKSNGDVNNGGSLNPGSYADYANYLQSFVTYMDDAGVPLYAISVQNEPDWLATYESCIWTGEQLRNWIANHASVLTTRVIMPEAVNFTNGSIRALADPTLDDPAAAANIDIVGGHMYGTVPTPYPNAVSKNKEVWMTEHSIPTLGIQGAMELAREIHESMAVGNYNAYVYWWIQNWIVGNSSPYRQGLINDPALNLELTEKGYVMGQFSKFIRPDYVRTTATANPSSGVYVSAYKEAGNGRFVIVAINTGASDVVQPFTIQNQTLTQLTPHRTSASERIAQQGAVDVVAGGFSYTLPGRSITTFVQ